MGATLVQPRLAELALDVVLAVEAVAAVVSRQALAAAQLASRREVFGEFASGPQGMPASNGRGTVADQIGGLDLAWAAAIGNWTPWFAPIGRPNTSRPLAYSTARSMNHRPSPMHSAAMRMRSAFSPSSR